MTGVLPNSHSNRRRRSSEDLWASLDTPTGDSKDFEIIEADFELELELESQ